MITIMVERNESRIKHTQIHAHFQLNEAPAETHDFYLFIYRCCQFRMGFLSSQA